MDANHSQVRSALEKDLADIERQLAEHGVGGDDEYSVPVDEDEGFADSAHATSERSERISLVEGLVSSRTELVAAIGRIDEGTYGKCERCGKEISPERLEALPTARLCLECKKLV